MKIMSNEIWCGVATNLSADVVTTVNFPDSLFTRPKFLLAIPAVGA